MDDLGRFEGGGTDDGGVPSYDYLFVGGGLATGLAVLAILARRPDARLTVVERDSSIAGNHTWCVHEDALDTDARELLAPLVVHRWTEHEVRFPGTSRVLGGGYVCITAERMRARLGAAIEGAPFAELLVNTDAVEVATDRVRLADGRSLTASVVIDGRGPRQLPIDDQTGYQKFVGLELELLAPHRISRPVLMDATGPQLDGFRFLYVLPLADDRLLIEDTCFSPGSHLDRASYRGRVLDHARALGLEIGRVVREEDGVLPMPYGAPQEGTDGDALRIGYGGGFFHPATGYTMPIAVRVAIALAAVEPMAARTALASLRGQLEPSARYARMLNALLFTCLAPEAMRGVFARFYKLPEPLISRFYQLALTRADRARILFGRPPAGISMRAAAVLIGGVS